MTQEEANLMYGENTLCANFYNPDNLNLLGELIKLSDGHPDTIYLSWESDKERHSAKGRLFDTSSVFIGADHPARLVELEDEMDGNEFLGNWSDSDCYDLSDETIDKLKKDTPKTKEILKKIIAMNDEFNELVYKETK